MTKNPSHDREAHDLNSHAKAFLGREFLLWFWRECEKTKQIDLEGEEIEFWVDDQISYLGSGSSSSVSKLNIKGNSPSHSRVARLALSEGMLPEQFKIGLRSSRGYEFSFVLTAELRVKSWKVVESPEVEAEVVGVNDWVDWLAMTDLFVESQFTAFLHQKQNKKSENVISSWIQEEVRS